MRPSSHRVYVGVASVTILAVAACNGKRPSHYAPAATFSRLAGAIQAIRQYYIKHGECPQSLSAAKITHDKARDEFSGKDFLYVTATDARGKRYACLLASSGYDGRFQLRPEMFQGKNVGRHPRNWDQPVRVARIDEKGIWQHNAEGGDLCVQFICNTHLLNELGFAVEQDLSGEEVKEKEDCIQTE